MEYWICIVGVSVAQKKFTKLSVANPVVGVGVLRSTSNVVMLKLGWKDVAVVAGSRVALR